jgi:hypothetical protein
VKRKIAEITDRKELKKSLGKMSPWLSLQRMEHYLMRKGYTS